MEDITKTGGQGYKALQLQNEEPYNSVPPTPRVRQFTPNQLSIWYEGQEQSPIMQQHNGEYWGSSRHDTNSATQDEWETMQQNPYEYRAQNQDVLSKWGAGLAKGIGLAATTFLDGTIGLLYGVADTATSGDYSRIWDNEVSNALQDFNEKMEVWLPNYRTQEEQNREWWQNMGTANFWADGVLKNLGFTVGAFYSGAAWTKGLKALGWVKKATSAQVVGSLLSGLNEGRIEANHGQREVLTLQNQMIDDVRDRRAMEIAKNDTTTDEEKIIELQDLDNDIAAMRQDALERAHQMGLTTLIGNTVLLSIDNLWQFGKLYSRGFNNAKGLANRIEAGSLREGIEDVVENEAIKYIPKVTSTGRKMARGLSNGLVEGNEEMAQAFIQSYAGHRQSYDSPDAYYEALTDPRAHLQTKDFLSSLAEGFNDSYGSRDRWEEFAVGAFTGLLGMPTFGKVANSDANTWIGKGRTIGISGGAFGEYRSATQAEREAKEATDVMNKYMDKLRTQASYFAQSQSFTDAMDGFAAESNNFEYKNASNNDDFAAISRFARTGRLNDLKEMVRQDFENMSDEQLVDIAMNTTPNVSVNEDGMVSTTDGNNQTMVGGWRNADGSLMSDTEEGRQQMRKELIKKRDKILKEIDQYEKSVETVRAIGNNSLTEDQINELAWLNWKTKMFEDRYNSLKGELDKRGILADLQGTVNDYVENIENADPTSLSEDANEVKKHMQLLGQYIEALRQSKTAMQLGQLIDANPEFQKALDSPLIEAVSGISHDVFVETMTQLQDLAKLGNAANQFNARYKDFVEHPINLIKNRQKIDKKKQKVAETMDREDKRTEVRETTVPEIVHAADIGEMSLDELEEMFPDDAEVQGKVKQAQAIRDGSQRVAEIIEEDESINEQTLNDAMKLLEGSKSVATDEEQLLDLEREAFSDLALLYDEDDPTLQDLPSQEELQAVLGERLDNAKTVLSKAIAQLRGEQASAAEATASPEIVTPIIEVVDNGEVGRDGVDKVESINEQKEQPADPVASATNRILKEVEGVSTIHDDIRDSYINNLSELVRLTEASKNAGMSMQDTYDVVRRSSMWNVLANLNAATGPAYIKWLNDLYAGKTQESPAPGGQEEVETSYAPTEDEAESQVDDIQQAQDDGRLGEILPDQYKYWKPTITELPIHTTRGSRELFYKVAGTMTKKNGTPRFTQQQLKRIEAVGNYLVQNGAFNRVNIGQGVQAGDMVGFRIDKTLNDQAGEPVILIIDKDGNVIGDIMSMNDPVAVNQTGLGAFTNRILAEYKKAGEPEIFTSKETSVIDKHMIGKVPFTTKDRRISLNSIHTNPNGSRMQFKLGIAMSDGPQAKMIMTPGRTKAQGQSADDLNIIPALKAKQGQPFFLMPTGDKKGRNRYIPIPIIMPKFNEVETGSAIYKAVQSVVSQIATGNNSIAAQIGNNLQELLGFQDIHINYNGENVKVHVRTKGMEHQVQIYNGAKNAENLVSSIMQSLQVIKTPIQVSRKYINTTYNGMDYNEMIGEYAMVNLNQGDTHTVSDWFTIRPLDASGKPTKTASPRNMGRNLSATVTGEKLTTITFNGNPVQVNLKTEEVFFNGQSYQGKRADAALAYAYGIENDLDMSNPYQTKWGYFNPNTLQFESLTVMRTIGSELIQPNQLNLNVNEETIKVNNIEQGLAIGQLYEMYDELEEDEFNKLKNQILDANTPEEIELARESIPMSDAAKNRWEDHKQYILESLQEQMPKEESKEEPKAVTTPSRLQSVNPDVEALKMGLLSSSLNRMVWNVLPQDVKKAIVDKTFIIAMQMMTKLRLNYDAAKQKFKKPINEILGIEKYRETAKSQQFDLNKELSWLSRVLPQFSNAERLQLVNGLTKMNGSTNIFGMFKQGVIYLNTANQSRGTTYHEAFHAVFNTLMSEKEVTDAYQSARNKWGNLSDLELEERLAEDFRIYTEYEQYANESSIKGVFVRLWRKLIRMIRHLLGRDMVLDRLYYDINRGKFSNRNVNVSRVIRLQDAELESIKAQAIANGTFMKAPNGKPTNLTERQWLQVRTKAFKDWFGDWLTNARLNNILDIITSKNGDEIVLSEGTDEYNGVRLVNIGDNIWFTTTKDTRMFSSISMKLFSLNDIKSDTIYLSNFHSLFPRTKDTRGSIDGSNYDLSRNTNIRYLLPIVQYKLFNELQNIATNFVLEGKLDNLSSANKMFKKFVEDELKEFDYSIYDINSENDLRNLFDNIVKDILYGYYGINSDNLKIESSAVLTKIAKDYLDNKYKYKSFEEYINNNEETFGNLTRVFFTVRFKIKGKVSDLAQILKDLNGLDNNLFENIDSSKVVDENGEPLVVYHGSRESFDTFRLDTKNRGSLTNIIKKGIYFSSESIAKQYASSKEKEDFFKLQEYEEAGYYFEEIAEAFGFNPREESELEAASKYLMNLEKSYGKFRNNLYAVFLNIRRPVEYDLKGEYIGSLTKEQKDNINSSEGAILYNVDETTGRYRGDITIQKMFVGTDYIVFNPNQVKSATDNMGTFSRESDDIRYRVSDDVVELERMQEEYNALETVAASNPEIQDIKEMLATTSQSMDMLRKSIEIQYSLVFDRLDADAQMAILNFGISQDEYAELTNNEKNNLPYCLGVL